MKKLIVLMTIAVVPMLTGCSGLYDADGGWSEKQTEER